MHTYKAEINPHELKILSINLTPEGWLLHERKSFFDRLRKRGRGEL